MTDNLMLDALKAVRLIAMSTISICLPLSAQAGGSLPDTVERKPSASDGNPAYQQDMQWLDPDGRSWVMRELARNRSVWLSEDPTGRAIDAIGGARPAAAYGTLRLTSTYAGPALGVVNSTTKTTATIGFLPDGSLDEAGFALACGRAECRVARWYDQSGHGLDAVQKDPSAQPIIRLSHRTGQAVSIIWDFEATGGGSGRSLALPSGLAIDSGNMGILWTGSFHSAALVSPLIELGVNEEAFNFGYWDVHGDFYMGTRNHLSELAGHAALTAAVGLISSSPGEGIVTNYRNQLIAQGKMPSETHRGGLIGQTLVYKQSGMMELSSLILYDRGLTPLERITAIQALGENFKIPQQQVDVYVADGDSMTQGIYTQYLQSYPWYLQRLLPRSLAVYNAGWATKTVGGAGGLLARYGEFTAKLYNPHSRTNVISLMAGTNDLQNGTDDKELAKLIQQYAILARKTGFKVVVSTILPRASFNPKMEAYRNSVNAILRKSWKDFADGIADLAGDPAFADAKIVGDSTIYAEDGIHLTDTGYQIVADAMSSTIRPLLER